MLPARGRGLGQLPLMEAGAAQEVRAQRLDEGKVGELSGLSII